ncbi:MAG: NUDIX domain-containing protein [Candidatus Daviesbacteria bacterium]|nr:NUDIX domain-containing protein [Candidatus Daviesbacteria bacterium]
MKREFSAGGIVFNQQGQVLVTQHSQNKHWSFPKGWIDPGESPEEAALREVKEEGGVEAEIVEKIGYNKYVYTMNGPARNASPARKDSSVSGGHSDAGGEKIFKVVTYFLMKYLSGDPKDHDWEVSEAGWYSSEDALKKLDFSQDKTLLKKALEMYGK